MPRKVELALRGQAYTSQLTLVDALAAAARVARKRYQRGRFSPRGWKASDPESYLKAVELGVMRSIFTRVTAGRG
ncbi:hypothetical protein AB9K35_16565 [Leisingera sp. XS_AS12]|uniref:hypothetical protein n=1 Tax=Leisingera TaxID=191028 RepID=UPI00048A40F6|nr:hypothetical protein [Leisingera caerulea]